MFMSNECSRRRYHFYEKLSLKEFKLSLKEFKNIET